MAAAPLWWKSANPPGSDRDAGTGPRELRGCRWTDCDGLAGHGGAAARADVGREGRAGPDRTCLGA